MITFLERYLAGDHLAVWADLRRIGPIPRDHLQWSDASSVVAETMRRTRRNIETIIARLRSANYEFTDTTYPPLHIGRPLSDPDEQSLKFCNWLDQLTGPIPLTLRGWIEIVGDVSLLGNHPDWPESEMYSDAMVVEFEGRECKPSADTRAYFASELEEWKINIAEDGLEQVGPFRLNFAPDMAHKVNVSGGGPYGIIVPDEQVDGVLDLDGRRIYFTDYLRECFAWGGFPGFATMPDRDNGTIAILSRDLLAI